MRKLIRNTGIALILALSILAVTLQPANAATHWKQKYIRFSATAGEALTIGQPVYIKASDGEAYKADADSSTARPAVGVVGNSVADGATVEIIVIGVLGGQTRVTPGMRLWLSTTAGGITHSIPTNEQALGWVMPDSSDVDSSAIYFIKVETPVNNGAGY